MATIVMDTDECEIAHEALLLKEFNEQMGYAGREPQLALVSANAAAKNTRHSYIQGRTMAFNIDLPASWHEVGDSVSLFLSSAFPKCP